MLSYDSWRACRLVVDTGLHAMGWSRQQAIDYMTDHSSLAKNNIVNEVDRYLGRPGQALAYKIGQLEMVRLRRETAGAPGSRLRRASLPRRGAGPRPAAAHDPGRVARGRTSSRVRIGDEVVHPRVVR